MGKLRHKKIGDFLNTNSELKALENSSTVGGQVRKSEFKKKVNTSPTKQYDELFDFLKLVKAWEEITGPKVGAFTLPLKCVRGTLTVLCSHPAWSKELSLMEESLKKKIISRFPQLTNSLDKLIFITSPGELLRLRENMLKNALPELEKNVQAQKYHPFSPKYISLKKEAQKKLETVLNNETMDIETKELLISLLIQTLDHE